MNEEEITFLFYVKETNHTAMFRTFCIVDPDIRIRTVDIALSCDKLVGNKIFQLIGINTEFSGNVIFQDEVGLRLKHAKEAFLLRSFIDNKLPFFFHCNSLTMF